MAGVFALAIGLPQVILWQVSVAMSVATCDVASGWSWSSAEI
jgi:hypothetical protein